MYAPSSPLHVHTPSRPLVLVLSLVSILATLFSSFNLAFARAPYGGLNGQSNAFVAQSASPSIWYVATAGDDNANDCTTPVTACKTIAAAIGKAADGDTVTIGAGTYNESFIIPKSLTLIGAGSDSTGGTIVNGHQQPDAGVFNIPQQTTVSIFGMRLQNGNATSGGSIANQGNLTISTSFITGNQSGSNGGGGIYNSSTGILTIGNSTISGNQATANNGGGLYNAAGGVVSISNTTINSNQAKEVGGGIYNLGSMTIISSTISSNLAAFDGGGIVNSGTLTVTNSTISDNITSSNDGAHGGGIANLGTLRLQNTTVRANTAKAPTVGGGGILNTGTLTIDSSAVISNTITGSLVDGGGIANTGMLRVRTSQISGNIITGDHTNSVRGGGLSNEADNATLTLDNSIVSNNSVTNQGDITPNTPFTGGGGISSFGAKATLVLTHSEVFDNSVSGVDLVWGGGILNRGNATLVATTRIRNNRVTATDGPAPRVANTIGGGAGGGIFNYYDGTLNIDNSSIISNTISAVSRAEGGGIFALSGSITLRDSTVNGNRAEAALGNGGGLDINGALINLIDSHIDNNIASTGTGGITSSGQLSVIGGSITGNSATNGGAMSNQGTAILTSTQVLSNTALLQVGGIQNSLTGSLTFTGGVIAGNSAPTDGGLLNYGTVILSGTAVISNTASDGGGAGIVNAGGHTKLSHSNVSNNLATSTRACCINGGGIVNDNATMEIDQTLISGNVISGASSSNAGGGIFNTSVLTITNSLLTGNRSVLGSATFAHGGGLYNDDNANATLTDTTISANSANEGAGIYNDHGTVGIIRGAISNNAAITGGGGIENNGGSIGLTNSTISSNTAASGGGVLLFNPGAHLNALNSTITANTASTSAGGIYNHGVTTLENSILANNNSLSAPDCLVSGIFASKGHNLLGNVTDCHFAATTSDLTNSDSKLGPLQDNGGHTPTHALLPGSPAIDAGNNASCPPTDQRGVVRPIGLSCDIGAFEASSTIDTGFKPISDTYGFANTVTALDPLAFFQDFGIAATTHTITETKVISAIQGETLDLPITFAQENIDAVLPISITQGLNITNSDGSETRYIPRPTAWLYEETIVKTLYQNDDVGSEYRGAILGGLCAGISTTDGAFKGQVDSTFDPTHYGSTDGSVRGIDYNQVSKLLARYQGRQVSAQILEYVARQGRYTPEGLYNHLAQRMQSPDWWKNPEIIGIYQGSGCANIEVGHALLPYRLEALPSGQARIYVYDSNYPPTAETPERFITLDAQTGRWSYLIGNNKANQPVVWTGDKLLSTPLALFTQVPQLPYLDGYNIIAVGGRMRGSLGGEFRPWGRMRGSLGGGDFDPNTSTGCIVGPDGITYSVENIMGSMRLIPLGGYLPQGYIFPNVAPLTVTGVGGNGQTGGDMLLFGPHGVMGFMTQTTTDKEYSATLDDGFRTLTLHTNDSPRPMSAFQMHETPDGSATRVFAVSNILVGSDGAITVQVAADLSNVQVFNQRDQPVTFQLGLMNLGSAAVTSTTRTFTIEPHTEYRYTPTNWNGLNQPITVERTTHDGRTTVGLVARYDFNEGTGSRVHDTSGSAFAPILRIAKRSAVRWGNASLEIAAPTTLEADWRLRRLMKRLDTTGAFSFESWIHLPNTYMGSGTLVDIGEDNLAFQSALIQQFNPTTTRFTAHTRIPQNGHWRTADVRTPQLPRSTDRIHIVLTRNADGIMRLYVDGVLRAKRQLVGKRDGQGEPNHFKNLLMLVNNQAGTSPWLGTLHLVAIYDRALTSAEVLRNYKAR